MLLVDVSVAQPSASADPRLEALAQRCGAELHVRPTPYGAVAILYGVRRIILLDPALSERWPYRAGFAVAHECGHHRLGHTRPEGMLLRSKGQAGKELDADCDAARTLLAAGEKEEAEAQRAIFVALGEARSDPQYPRFDERAAVIARCLAAPE